MDLSGDLLARLFSPQSLWIALWVGLAVFTGVLIALLHTRLGTSKPLQKCTILAVWFHLLLLIYATSIQVVAERQGGGNQVTINLSAGGDSAIGRPDTPNDVKKRIKELPVSMTTPTTKLLAPTTVSAPRVVPPLTPAARPPAKIAPATTSISIPAPATKELLVAAPKPTSLPKTAETTPRVAAESPAPPKKPAPEIPSIAKAAPAKLEVPKPVVAAAPPEKPAKLPAPAELKIPEPSTPAAKPPVQPQNVTTQMTRIRVPADVATLPQPTAPPVPEVDPAVRLLPIIAPEAASTSPATNASEYHIPQLYQQRSASDRDKIAAAHGGSDKTEASVKLALKWIATHQEADGRWNPRRFGAGQESETLGHNRGGAGAKADAGITGLALLALLGAGHTHQRGDYKQTVAAALQFIIDAQHPNGNLGGEAEPFAFMYCHGMATLAISEALAMTGDDRLRDPVRRAIAYTLASQNRTTGGWRYRPHESGDLSQLGWQLIALKSAELGGIEVPTATRDGMSRFLQSVSSGNHGGLASYRAGERVSRPMTAEGLVCKQFLGMARQNPASDEAGDYLLGELPGIGQSNYYYWYYGTLSMYQLQGQHWQKWNEALTTQLLRTQVDRGENVGSWEPDDLWGSYGGRVYSTALATLCLEVYYRYLPLYVEAAANGSDTLRK